MSRDSKEKLVVKRIKNPPNSIRKVKFLEGGHSILDVK